MLTSRLLFVPFVLILLGIVLMPSTSSAQAGLAAAYGFNEGSGSTVTDASGNGNDGVVTGAVWTPDGRFGSALEFDGLDDWVTVVDAASLDLGSAMAIEAWVYPTNRSRSAVFVKELAGGLAYALLAGDNGMRPAVRINTSAEGERHAAGTSQLPLDTWTHVAATYDGSTLSLFINGIQVSSPTVKGQIQPSTEPLRIGGRSDRDEFFQGRIDEIRIYSRSLSAAEIQTDMNTALSDLTAPTVAITRPGDASAVVDSITISADASDNVAVAGVQFMLDGTPLGAEDTASPYEMVWDTTFASPGSHILTAIARDGADNRATSAPVSVMVLHDAAAPTVAITTPLPGSDVSGVITVAAEAADDMSVAGVQFMLDGVPLGPEDTAAPYEIAWNTTLASMGTHLLTAIARDAAGNRTTSAAVSVTVSNDTTAPTVAITSPAAGSALSGVVTVTASASDNTGVAGVQFLLDGAVFGPEDTAAPYSVSWNTALSADGNHALSARARDAAGNLATSVSVGVTVSNASGPSLSGAWSAPTDIGLVMVHATLMHTGKVLMWRGESAGGASASVWDPSTGTLTAVPNGLSNLFCSGHTALADGTILVAGGHDNEKGILGSAATNLFDPVTQAWRTAAPMAHRRWYPTATTLPDGRVLVVSGANECLTCLVAVPELYDPMSDTWSQLTSASLPIPLYPFMFVLPDGRLLNAGTSEEAIVSRTLAIPTQIWTTVDANIVDGGSAVMYAPGKVMKSGSAGTSGNSGLAAATAYALDMTQATPAWRQIASMAFPRAYHNLVMLPDGNVFAVGGGRTLDGADTSQAVLDTELWSPATETWQTMAPLGIPRLYHGTALLLPDGRVLVGGSGDDFGVAPEQTTIEIYSPPYLFRGARPAIGSAPANIAYGSTFAVQSAEAASVTSVVLIRPASVTHQFDQNQRFLSLSFEAIGDQLAVQAPANANLAPPGHYMLFIVNSEGVPSVASFVRLPAPSDDTQPPTAPTGLTATGSTATISLAWSASTDDTGVAAYNVHRSIASGFAPSAVNRIARVTSTSFVDSGLAAGTYHYLVTAEDVRGNVSAPSAQASATASADTTAPNVAITQPADAATVSGIVAVTASASDEGGVAGVQFLLDGSAIGGEDTSTPYSISWSTLGVPNGSHVLTAVARDAAGNRATSVPVSVTVSNTTTTPPGLVAAYGFNEGTGSTVGDASGTGNTGIISGASWTSPGHSGSALTFDGIDDWVTVSDAASLDLTTGMTLEAWVNPATVSSWRTVVLKETVGGLAYALYSSDDGSFPAGFIRISQDVAATGSDALPVGTWTHLAVTYDGAALRLFVNGVETAATTISGTVAESGQPLRIGGNSVWTEFFSGRIDDVRVYNRALTAAEIQLDMATPVQ